MCNYQTDSQMSLAIRSSQPLETINKHCMKFVGNRQLSAGRGGGGGVRRKYEPCSFHTPHSPPRLPVTSAPQTSPTCETREFTNESTAFTHTSHPAVITHSHICFNDNWCVHFSKCHLAISFFLFFLLVSEPVCEFYINYLNHLLGVRLEQSMFVLGPWQTRTSEAK